MKLRSKQFFVLSLLLAAVFLAAQLHCCIDPWLTSTDTHSCPVCSTVGVAVATDSMILEMTPALQRLEIRSPLFPQYHTASSSGGLLIVAHPHSAVQVP